MNRPFVTCMCALIALNLSVSAQGPTARATGDQRRQYVFAPTGQQMPYRVYVPKTWNGKASLPIILMLHGAGANEGTYLDQADGLLMKLAEQHGYIVVSPLGFTPLGAYGNPLRLPAVFGQSAAAASQRAAVTPTRQRELNLSELEVMTALEIVTEEYGADRSRTYLAGHSMGSGGAWHLAARYPERWRAVAPMSGPFLDEATYPFDRIRRLPIFMTEGTGATPSLDGSRVLARYMGERGFAFEYLEVDGNHGSMVPMVWPRIFEFFNRQGKAPTRGVDADAKAAGAAACTTLGTALFAAVARLTTTYEAGSAAQPAHCVVRGSAAPRTGVDGKAYETRFELRLPTDWSGRFLYQGGGGNDGVVAPAVGRNTGSFPDTGLQRGFAVVTTDAGHQGATAEFGLDPEARIDHAYAAHERTAALALTVVSRYYGRAPNRKYFVGCSGGGRQGMMFAQRYPSYFDGIAICAPAMSVSSGATIAAAWDTQTYMALAPADEQGQRVLSRAFSDADLALVARGITEACDAADGATDRMVLRPESCRFDPNRLKCAAAKQADCLTAEQVAALQRTFGGPRDSSGKSLYVGQPWDPGIATAGWRQWKLGTSQTSTANAINATLMAGALAHEFFTPPDPSFAITQFNFDRDPKRMDAFSAVYDTYRDASLAEFGKRGGKLLIFHGTADPIFSALESIDYYQRLTRNNGGADATAAWARLFLVPGMNHCAGGPATDSFDGLGAIVDWMEKGTAPARIEASARPGTTYFAGRTRPLCPYPAYARYAGTGSLEDGANFVCAAK